MALEFLPYLNHFLLSCVISRRRKPIHQLNIHLNLKCMNHFVFECITACDQTINSHLMTHLATGSLPHLTSALLFNLAGSH